MSKKIIAIGGGELGRPGYNIETTEIDKEIVKLTGKKHPKLLFLPTATGDSELYCSCVEKEFENILGCEVTHLKLISDCPNKESIEKMILSTDIIYVGGGNTLKMLDLWKELGIDKLLKKAINKGIVLSGLSAGSICWFKHGCSDSLKFKEDYSKDEKQPLIKIDALGFIDALHCPHYDVEEGRKESLKEIMRDKSIMAIAIDNCCALEVIDDSYRIISSKDTANAYLTYWENDEYIEKQIPKFKKFSSLEDMKVSI